jgi:hypothetical protein
MINLSGGADTVEGSMGSQLRGALREDTEMATLGRVSGGVDTKSAFSNLPSSNSQRGGDPFYLSSPAAHSARLLDSGVEGVAKDGADSAATRFGSIKLDSGGESDEGYSGEKAKKKKKKRSMKAHHIVGSDDEDDNINMSRPKRGYVSKELKNLALVDLTTPLGEDDVMPRNEHYVVPERQAEAKGSKGKTKKKKSSNKNKSSKSKSTIAVGDLLAFDSPLINLAGTRANDFNVESSNNNPINSAFDDLLGLEMPHPPVNASTNTAMVPIAEVVGVESNVMKSKEKKPKKDKHKGKKSPKKTKRKGSEG